jgi:pyridoxamine 5'-phosphate oxidase
MSIAHLRTDYHRGALEEAAAEADPYGLFARWFEDARAAGVHEVNAMTLATVASGQPTARIVLLKGFDADGFVFFTNYDSRKGAELAANPAACLLAFWAELERQVRIDGQVERVSAAESDTYFALRPREARIGAWASPQSAPIADRAALEARFEAMRARFATVADADLPRPPHWGGFRLRPAAIEFWQGRPSRLHDRLLYKPDAGLSWTRQRLAP